MKWICLRCSNTNETDKTKCDSCGLELLFCVEAISNYEKTKQILLEKEQLIEKLLERVSKLEVNE